MTEVTDVSRPPPDVFPSHPRLREWKSLITSQGMAATLEIEFWPGFISGGLDLGMTVHFQKEDQTPLAFELGWDNALNAGLVKLKVRAVDSIQESERFSMSLDAAFTPAECVRGDGFFNSVLFDYVKENELGKDEVIAGILRVRSVVALDQKGPNYVRCREMIDGAIRGRALELKDDLGYSMDEAWTILVGAFARYLDRRFSITIRRQRGLL